MNFIKVLIIAAFTLFVFNMNAQYKVFLNNGKVEQGNIITESVGVFTNEIALEKENSSLKIKTEEVDRIEKDSKFYKRFGSTEANMFFKNKNAMLLNVLDGKIKLWSYKYSYQYQQKQNAAKKTAIRNIFYVQDQTGNLKRLDQNNYLKTLRSILTGNKQILQVLQNRGYSYNQIPSIVKRYNNMHN